MRETNWGCLMSSQHTIHLPSLFLDRGHLQQTKSLEHHDWVRGPLKHGWLR